MFEELESKIDSLKEGAATNKCAIEKGRCFYKGDGRRDPKGLA
jgi:hypothetical protein